MEAVSVTTTKEGQTVVGSSKNGGPRLCKGNLCFSQLALEQTPPVFVVNITTCVFDFFVSITATVSNALIIYVILVKQSSTLTLEHTARVFSIDRSSCGQQLVAPLNILNKTGEMVNYQDFYCVSGGGGGGYFGVKRIGMTVGNPRKLP